MTEKKTKVSKPEAPTERKSSRAWLWATMGVAAALIGGVVYYGQVIYPVQRAEQIAKNDVIACEGFYKALRAEKTDLDHALKTILNASDDAIELYDPEFNDADPNFGKVYEAFLRLSDAGITALTGDAVLGFENFNKEIIRTEDICYPILVAADREKLRQSPAPTN